MIITFKGVPLDFFYFYNLLKAPRSVSNTYTQVARAQSFANHVQHIARFHLRHVVLRSTWYEGAAHLLSLTEFSLLWLGEKESLICSVYLSVVVHTIVWADPFSRSTIMLLGRWAAKHQTGRSLHRLCFVDVSCFARRDGYLMAILVRPPSPIVALSPIRVHSIVYVRSFYRLYVFILSSTRVNAIFVFACMSVSVCLSVTLSVCLSVSPSLFICLSVSLFLSHPPFLSVSVCLSVTLSVCLSVSPSLFICLSLCFSLTIPFSLFLSVCLSEDHRMIKLWVCLFETTREEPTTYLKLCAGYCGPHPPNPHPPPPKEKEKRIEIKENEKETCGAIYVLGICFVTVTSWLQESSLGHREKNSRRSQWLPAEHKALFEDCRGRSLWRREGDVAGWGWGLTLRPCGLDPKFHLLDSLVGLVVKASASRAEDPGFESRLRRDIFLVDSYQWLKNWHSSGHTARHLVL